MKPVTLAAIQGLISAVLFSVIYYVFEMFFSDEGDDKSSWTQLLLSGTFFGLLMFFYYWFQLKRKQKNQAKNK